jgi:hypothetical protein
VRRGDRRRGIGRAIGVGVFCEGMVVILAKDKRSNKVIIDLEELSTGWTENREIFI